MRKREFVPIKEEGRDKGKVFVLTEMPATRAEKWATRALLAVSKSGVDLPENAEGAGMAGLALLGLRALSGLDWRDAEPLLDEMFECVQVQPLPQKSPDIVRPLVEEDIEEVATRVYLRAKIFELHTGFSVADARFLGGRSGASAQSSSTTRTSLERSEP